jgi:ketosteroid isomerase-like protein
MYYIVQLIDTVMKEDLAEVHSKKRRPRKDGKQYGYFEEVVFSVADWQAMRDMLDILTVSFNMISFVFLYLFL